MLSTATNGCAALCATSEITCSELQLPEINFVEANITLIPLDTPCQVRKALVLFPVPPIAMLGDAEEVLVMVDLGCQFIPNNFVEASIFPLLTQAAITSPATSTHKVGDEAPLLESEVALLQFPLNGFEAAFTIPFVNHIAVALPLPSITKRGLVKPVAHKVTAADQPPLTVFELAFTKLFSTHMAMASPLVSIATCGSEALTPDPDRIWGIDDQLILLL